MKRCSNRVQFPRIITAVFCLYSSVALADELRLVVEIRPEQSAGHIEETAAALFGTSVDVSPLFADVNPNDDPFELRNLYTVRADTDADPASAWDSAYLLLDSGDFLRVEPDLRDVLIDSTARGFCRSGVDDINTEDPAWSLLAVNADEAWRLPPRPGGRQLGEGARICHVDTGWSEHEDLDVENLDLASDYDVLDDDDVARDPLDYDGHLGHGTSTGSIIASSGGIAVGGGTVAPGKITGVAPGATLVPIRSIKSVVQFLDSDVAKAVRKSVEARCDVISMSLGGRAFFGLERALMDAVRNDVIPVAAAGNCVGFVVAPAMYDATIAAAASNVDGKPWQGSSRGSKVNISAPGERVHVAWKKSPQDSSSGTVRSDGTSYATAMTAGAAALWVAFHGDEALRGAQGTGTRKDLFLKHLTNSAYVPDGWDKNRYGAGILDTAALLRSPLGSPDAATRRTATAQSQLDLLSQITGRESDQLRGQLEELLGADDFTTAMNRYGSELTYIAVSEPESLQQILDAMDGSSADIGSRQAARSALATMSSRSLFDFFSGSESEAVAEEAPAVLPDVTQRVLLEIDRMSGTRAVDTVQTIRGERVALADIYRSAGIELRIVEDQTDIPRVNSLRLADLHALLSSNRSLVPEEGEQHMYMLVVTEDDDSPSTLGIMFDFGRNDANDVPRESFAVFESAHRDMPGGISRELLLTTAHELAHAFNLHHTDWDGSSFTRRSTVESYSLANSVQWRLSDASIEHLGSHPERLVTPGAGNLPFGMIVQEHADGHKSSPRENYAVVPADTSQLRRDSGIDTSAAVRTQLADVNDVSEESPLQLRIRTIKDSYVVGEAVSLTVAVVNTGDSPRDIMPLLSPEYGFLNILIKRPGQQEFRPFNPPVLREARMAALRRTLPPRDALIDDARIFFSASGWTFETPGDYEIRANFPADTEFSNDVISSETQRITITAPDTETTSGAGRLLFGKGGFGLGSEQGIFLYMGGGDHLEFGAARLRELVRDFPTAQQADPAKVALASEALQPTLDQSSGARPEARIDEAQHYLRGITGSDTVPGVTLMRVQQRMIQGLETEGRDEEARSFRKDFTQDMQESKDLQVIDRELVERDFE